MGQIENKQHDRLILTISTITLNVNDLNTLIKRQNIAHCIKKQNKKPTLKI